MSYTQGVKMKLFVQGYTNTLHLVSNPDTAMGVALRMRLGYEVDLWCPDPRYQC